MTFLCVRCAEVVGPDSVAFCEACQLAAATAFALVEKGAIGPAKCFNCEKSFQASTLKANKGFCGRCINKRSDSTEDHEAINHQLARVVWLRYYGLGSHITERCYCCGEQDITVWTFQCGHVVARAKGGPTTVDNLRPICAPCNQGMGTIDMRDFAKTHGFGGGLASEGATGSKPVPTNAAAEADFVVVMDPEPPKRAQSGRHKKPKSTSGAAPETRPQCAIM